MAWGARQHDDGTWRLCERKGRTILCISRQKPDIEVIFAGRAACKRCADALNDAYWAHYAKTRDKTVGDVQVGMIAIIRDHGGITQEQYERLYV